MSRVKIIFPKREADFQTDLQIRITDINYGNHLANDKLVALLHESRVQMLSDWNYTEFDLEGAALIQADLMVRYRNEAFLGETLHFELFLTNINSRSFDLLYQISLIREGQTLPVADAKTELVCFDYTRRQVIPVPEAFAARFTH